MRVDYPYSEDNPLAVSGTFHLDLTQSGQNIFAHMGQDDSPASQPLSVFHQGAVVQMVFCFFLPEVSLTDKQVCFRGGFKQGSGPLGIPRITDHLASALDAKSV